MRLAPARLHSEDAAMTHDPRTSIRTSPRPRRTGLRLLPGRFMVIRQAMGLPRARGEAAAARLHEFVESMKASGFVAEALARHQVAGVTLAPPAGERPVSTE